MSTSHLLHDDDEIDDEEDEVSEEGALHSASSKECITTTDSQSEGGFKNDATPPQNRQVRPSLKMRSLSHDEYVFILNFYLFNYINCKFKKKC